MLAGLIAGHLVLALVHHHRTNFAPVISVHSASTRVVDFTRVLQGYLPAGERDRLDPGFKTVFEGERDPDWRWSDPRDMVEGVLVGRLKGLWWSPDYGNDIPVTLLLPALVHEATGGSLVATAMTPQLFLALLLCAIYGIGSRLSGPYTGLAAASVASGYSGLITAARTHHDVIGTTAFAAVVVYLILRSDGFSRLGVCSLGGAAAALCTRAGESVAPALLAAVIVLGPFAIEAIHAFRRQRSRSGKSLRWAAGMGLFVFPPLLMFNPARFALFLSWSRLSAGELSARPVIGDRVPDWLAEPLRLLAYFVSIASDLVGPLMTLWLIAGAFLLCRTPRAKWMAIALAFAIPMAYLSWMPKKATYYLIPLLPALALITILGLEGIQNAGRRRWAVRLAAFSGLLVLAHQTLAPKPYWSAQGGISTPDNNSVRIVRINSIGIAGEMGSTVPSRASTAAHELVDYDLNFATRQPGLRRILAFADDTATLDQFRYIVELRQPDLFVLDLLHPVIKVGTRLDVLRDIDHYTIEYLIWLGDAQRDRFLPLSLFQTVQWRLDLRARLPEERTALLEYAFKSLRGRTWQRVELPQSVLYVDAAGPIAGTLDSSSIRIESPDVEAIP